MNLKTQNEFITRASDLAEFYSEAINKKLMKWERLKPKVLNGSLKEF
jgi:hypothetical protein